jgi:hypothetical protein
MTYLFLKAEKYMVCELRKGPVHVLRFIVVGPGEVEMTERYSSADALQERWQEVRAFLQHDGWSGPVSCQPRGVI